MLISFWKSVSRRNRDSRPINFVVCVADIITRGGAAHASWHRGRQTKTIRCRHRQFKKVTELEPRFADGFVSLGQTYMEKREIGSAIAPLKHALDIDPNMTPAHRLLGYALLAQG